MRNLIDSLWRKNQRDCLRNREKYLIKVRVTLITVIIKYKIKYLFLTMIKVWEKALSLYKKWNIKLDNQ